MDAKAVPLFECSGINKSFSGTQVLFDVGFAIKAGEFLGVIGENGSGKSTTMNIIGGILRPDSGEMRLNGDAYVPTQPNDAMEAGIGFIHQELNIFGNMSVADNMMIGRYPRRWEKLPFINHRAKRLATAEALKRVGLDVSPDAPCWSLAPGERQLLEIAKVVSQNPRMIIFDEPTTSLTEPECRRLFEVIADLQAQGIGIVYISHVLSDVQRLSDRIVVLRDGHAVKSTATRDLTRDGIVEAMVGRPVSQLYPDVPPLGERRPVIEVQGLTQPRVLKDVSFSIAAGEVLGVAGLMGSGRSELARILFGLDPHDGTGTISYEGAPFDPSPRDCVSKRMAFLTEDRRHEGLLLTQSLTTNLELVHLSGAGSGAHVPVDRKQQVSNAEDVAHRLRIKARDLVRLPAKSLSGGNQQKVVLGKWLVDAPRLFILDEPTRGIDVGAKEEIYRVIAELAGQGLAVMLISSELEELAGLSHRIMVMSRGMNVGVFERQDGGFDRAAIMARATAADVEAA
ncbi:ribose transport system ATP-binding protein/inositol transport system ATP-binding protein [Aliiruegeria haliotis]|uniref:Ribose transport system ATP-binding protein/inositol transport system ATP-binding protein n=1 Tax=Aliiruegeria haliotis TaxID=1280846 RepID=A0A2T0RLX3_9RHOB|nr:sugar ABC transporter ATP-binding protein [Aliiruegeria haliotis]PRY22113.1 ribose transport system ATP-binding protein/inositol transport system ATP-binding protein [Aliiruegeria haliotis]